MSGSTGMGPAGLYIKRNVVPTPIVLQPIARGELNYAVPEARIGDVAVVNLVPDPDGPVPSFPDLVSTCFARVVVEGQVRFEVQNNDTADPAIISDLNADICLLRGDIRGSTNMGEIGLQTIGPFANEEEISLTEVGELVLPCPGVRVGDVVFLEMQIANTVAQRDQFRPRGVRVSARDEVTLGVTVTGEGFDIPAGALDYRLAVMRSAQFAGEEGWDGYPGIGTPNGETRNGTGAAPVVVEDAAAQMNTATEDIVADPLLPYLDGSAAQVHSWRVPESCALLWAWRDVDHHFIRMVALENSPAGDTPIVSAGVCNGTQMIGPGFR